MCSKCFDGKGYPDHRERNVYRVEDEDDVPRHTKKRGKRGKRPRPKPGCPANDGNAHIYAIIEIRGWEHSPFWDRNGPWVEAVKWQRRCIGCGKVYRTYGSQLGSPIGRHFNEEDIFQVEYIPKGEAFNSWW